MSIELVLQLFKYIIYLSFVISASLVSYTILTTKQQRVIYRTKVQKELAEKRKILESKAESSTLANLLRQAGNPLRITAFKFQIIRFCIFVFLIIHYIVNPVVLGDEITFFTVSIIMSVFILTGTASKFSITKFVLNQFVIHKQKRKREELFTLYDMIESELSTLNNKQEVNVHNLLKGLLDYFEHINVGLIKFMRLWKNSPHKAKEAFCEEIGGEHAEVLANILYQMDYSSKEQAIAILKSSSDVFSVTYFEEETRKGTKKITAVELLLFSGNLLSLVWLLIMIMSMFGNIMDGF